MATPRAGRERRKRVEKRRVRKPDRDPRGAFALARMLVLAPIVPARGPGELGELGELAGPDGSAWSLEPAWDGHRVLATRAGDDVRLASADFKDWTLLFPGPARALAALRATTLAIDGAICLLDARGAPSFELLRARVATGAAVTGAVMICTDLLWLDDDDLRALPLSERRTKLAALLAGAPAALAPSQQLPGSLADVVAAARTLGLRGVIARAPAAAYGSAAHGISTTAEPVDARRSLSPPPPLTNADKVLYPRDGICKRDLVAYYRDVAPILVPHLLDRPVVIQRWPDGIDEFDWYQHRMPPRAPDYLRAAVVDGVRRIVIENGDALLWLVNQAGLTYHGFASRLAALAEPDFAVIDLDPGDRTTWPDVVDIALAVRRVLDLLELPSVVKTSGQRGIHILVPVGSGHTFVEVERLGAGVGALLCRLMPDRCTLEMDKDKRLGRLLVDTKQHLAKTLVVPYSLRAADGAPVSTPIAWAELTPALDPRALTLRTVRDRLDRVGDLAAPLRGATTRLGPALAQLLAQRF